MLGQSLTYLGFCPEKTNEITDYTSFNFNVFLHKLWGFDTKPANLKISQEISNDKDFRNILNKKCTHIQVFWTSA